MSVQGRSAKPVTRRAVRSARAARSAGDPSGAAVVAAALAAHVAAAVTAALDHRPAPGARPGALTVAAYRSVRGEPGTRALREELRRTGHRVLLPVLLPDLDLDWVVDDGGPDDGDPLRPLGPGLGGDALRACALVLVPALAVDGSGTRLGQGGGSYDRALARLPDGPGRPLVLAVVHDDEVLEAPLAREAHDVPVDGALTPAGLVPLGR